MAPAGSEANKQLGGDWKEAELRGDGIGCGVGVGGGVKAAAPLQMRR